MGKKKVGSDGGGQGIAHLISLSVITIVTVDADSDAG